MFQPLHQEQVIQTAQVLLAYLENPMNSTPNNMVEGIVSGKSLLRGILSGELVICKPGNAAPAPKKKVAKKKAAKKKKSKRQPTV